MHIYTYLDEETEENAINYIVSHNMRYETRFFAGKFLYISKSIVPEVHALNSRLAA